MQAVTSSAVKAAKQAQPALKKILMCRPTHFDVIYSINPWMDLSKKVDKLLAQAQWINLKTTLEQCGADVHVMESQDAPDLPDIVFVANAAVFRGSKAYIAHFAHAARQGESFMYSQALLKAGYQCHYDPTAFFEGAGDALWAGENLNTLFVGVGPRTDTGIVPRMKSALADGTKWDAVALKLVDQRYYHLDTAYCTLNEELAIWNPKAFDQTAAQEIKSRTKLIEVCDRDAANFACNAVVVGKNVVMHKGNERTAEKLAAAGFTARFVDMSEFIKAGGSAKCCTLHIP